MEKEKGRTYHALEDIALVQFHLAAEGHDAARAGVGSGTTLIPFSFSTITVILRQHELHSQ